MWKICSEVYTYLHRNLWEYEHRHGAQYWLVVMLRNKDPPSWLDLYGKDSHVSYWGASVLYRITRVTQC